MIEKQKKEYFFKKKFFKRKVKKFLRKYININFFFYKKKNLKILQLKNNSKKNKIKYIINIKITQNNIFCTLRHKKKTLIILSSGVIKVKVSKKRLKFSYRFIIDKFIRNLKKFTKNTTSLITISGPITIKKKVLIRIINKLDKSKFFININTKKSFNGCRPKKQKRKKIKGKRIFK
jgi:ribosomal protein S11